MGVTAPFDPAQGSPERSRGAREDSGLQPAHGAGGSRLFESSQRGPATVAGIRLAGALTLRVNRLRLRHVCTRLRFKCGGTVELQLNRRILSFMKTLALA